jgi:hypothetical protein
VNIYLKITLSITAIALSSSCTDKAVEIDDLELLTKSKAYAKEYSNTLKKNLKNALEEGGIENAIEFCHLNAIPLSDSISKAKQLTFSRVSHKNRNPSNKVSSFELSLIEQYNQSKSKIPKLFQKGSQNLFYAPIYIDSPLCLNCHGKTELSQAVSNRLYQLYPNDLARGFSEGELRGLLKIIYEDPQ